MRTLKELIADQRLYFVKPDMTVLQAATYMDIHNIGALPVISEKNNLSGIISERDIIRRCVVKSLDMSQTKVGDIMTKTVIVVESHDTPDYGLKIMKQENIRHLPVREGTELLGMVSMRDLLVDILNEKEEKIEMLNFYIQYSG
ncbi:CBS domain-containing protein [Ignavibacteria bacterium CHB1]|nr:MAG: CBS domain-containing protein [Chlorobiota bacterium]MBV6399189.1 Inosine-5'-monophosphate dehydrogenase [Ignavibacteria bacterium]MCC6885364.1 CBS domain-containing protein [Ignavibacteriales bacterium]MCE7953607.1 CBS domain-containing protein [Chlorobi bacterium CHB7]MDL1887503.1 CBS domain-containing protein [Ignavibacteria bacterium CHB1]RIK49208.1 MAG: histidine kinase [Ignavibacteriota bacterium]